MVSSEAQPAASGMPNSKRQRRGRDFSFCIDRGGTFTDIYAEVPGEPTWRVLKLLSEDPANYSDAPLEGIRRILEEVTGDPIPRGQPVPTERIRSIRMGTTVATNALLERKGCPTALCVTAGFRDVLAIGTQARPRLFDLSCRRPSQLYAEVLEVDERVQLVQEGAPPAVGRVARGVSGEMVEVVRPVDLAALRPQLEALLRRGVSSLAVAFLHSYAFPDHERAVAELARSLGFRHVSASADLLAMVRLVPRAHTATLDAYLTPGLGDYLARFVAGFDKNLSEVNVAVMQSDGGLVRPQVLSGCKALLSGPAGGVVGYARASWGSAATGRAPLIGLDMGGTSTDVSRYAGRLEHVLEATLAGVPVMVRQLDITTVAAGGGSCLSFAAGVFKVGPESAGAHPGPACYGKGGPLAVTDANAVLGRVLPDYFPHIFGPKEDAALDVAASRRAFEALLESLRGSDAAAAVPETVEELALGFVRVANEAMARPIRELTEARGHDPRTHVLSCFGGAGPQHACALARTLGIQRVVVQRLCGVLSAVGMGLADAVAEAQEPCALAWGEGARERLEERRMRLEGRVRAALKEQGVQGAETAEMELLLNLRYEGTDTAIMIPPPAPPQDYGSAFVERFSYEYGFSLLDRPVLVDDVCVRGVVKSQSSRGPPPLPAASGPPTPEPRSTRCYFEGGWRDTQVFVLDKLAAGHELAGPVVIVNGNSTILVEPGCTARVAEDGAVVLDVPAASAGSDGATAADLSSSQCDLVELSLFANRFMGIAEQMGRTLQRTAISTNIKERLDFSCALFGAEGGLVANAPHVPVHLGAMASSVRWQLERWRGEGGSLRLAPGDVLLTNHPSSGGSHLPDMTVITPVFREGQLVFLVASRGHHADVGGATPGSMPPFSKSLAEEGAAIDTLKLVEGGVFAEATLRSLLLDAGARKVDDNVSDLRAQVAANQRGITLLEELIEEQGLPRVLAYMGHVQANAEGAVRAMLRNMALSAGAGESPLTLTAEDYMDDGSVIRLRAVLHPRDGSADLDFAGTSVEVHGNWNAPTAVTTAAVIYCIRALVGTEIPLNQGCLTPIRISIPPGSLLSPTRGAAVVGGNVLTSQRVTDVILRAFGAAAASQGCMNNLTFGNTAFGYYETIGGGAGAGPTWSGESGVQCHMTNTRITDAEVLERRYPVLLHRFEIRRGSGGAGLHPGGDGIVRELEFRAPLTVSILSERRAHAPPGLAGGGDGARGLNILVRAGGRKMNLGGKNSVEVLPGDRLCIHTPGGGGWGAAAAKPSAPQEHK